MRYLLILLMTACFHEKTATENAKGYIDQMYPESTSQTITCENWDSDQDGRVRCNVSFMFDQEHIVETINCPGTLSLSKTCTPFYNIKGK